MKFFILLSHIDNYLALYKSTVPWSKMPFPQSFHHWFYCPQVSCVSDEQSEVHSCEISIRETVTVVIGGT